MTSFPILDVAIGLCFFYLLLGLVCSTVNEIIAAKWKRRATYLDRGINSLLGGDAALKKLLYGHPLIGSLVRMYPAKAAKANPAATTNTVAPTTNPASPAAKTPICPSYIPADKFATALMDILSGTGNPHTNVDAVKTGVATKTPELKGAMTALIEGAEMDAAIHAQDAGKGAPLGANPPAPSQDQIAAALHKRIEDWFNDGMDRVTGWYKRRSQVWNWILAAVVTLLMNADTLHVADILWTSPTARAAMVQAAQSRVAQAPPGGTLPMVEYPNPNNAKASKPTNVPSNPEDALTAAEKQLLGELTGWTSDCKKLHDRQPDSSWLGVAMGLVWMHLLGWILTVIAVSMGAPFWFDVLKRFMNIRNTGRKPGDQRPKADPSKA